MDVQGILGQKSVKIEAMMDAWVDSEGHSPFDNSVWAVAVMNNPHTWYTERGVDFSPEERKTICQEMENGSEPLRAAYIAVLKDRANLQESYRAAKTRWSSHAHSKLIELGVEYRPRPTVPMARIPGEGNVPDIVLQYNK